MPHPFSINLGGIPVLLSPDKSSGLYDFTKKTKEFATSQEPVVELRVQCGWFPELSKEQIVFETNFAWQMFRIEDKLGIKIRNKAICQLGIFQPDFLSGDIYVASKAENPNIFIFPLSHPLGELYAINLLNTGFGMLSHAAGVIYKGEGYIFAGKGGAGKTTTSQLWAEKQGAMVLNDDKVIIRQEEKGFRLYGTPWHGQGGIALMDSAPLKHVFLLRQSKKNYCKELSHTSCISRLLNATFLPLWDKEKMAFSLKFLDELVGSLPCEELGFTPDQRAVEFVLSHSKN